MKKLLTISFLLSALQAFSQFASFRPAADNAMNMYHARCVIQDKTGFIWIGSGNGLYRYDGYHYQQMRTTNDPNLLPDESVQQMGNWGDRFLWIRLRGNLYSCFDVQENRFVNWNGVQSGNEAYRRYTIIDHQHLWLYDDEKGCCHVENHDDGTISTHDYNVQNHTLPSNNIRFIVQDKKGVAWIGTEKGLARIHQGKSTLFLQDQNFACAQQAGNDLYFITQHGSIYRMTSAGIRQEHIPSSFNHTVRNVAYQQDTLIITTSGPTMSYAIRHHQLSEHPHIHIDKAQMVFDKQGNKVIFNQHGTDLWYFVHNRTYHLPAIYSEALTQQNGGGRFRFVCGSQGRLWVSTYGNGLHAYDIQTNTIKHFHGHQGLNAMLSSDYLLDMFEDKSGLLWVCQENQGIRIINQVKQSADVLYFTNPDNYGHANTIRLIQKAGGQILIGNRLNNLWLTDKNLQNIKTDNPYGDDVVAVNTDKQGRLWIGTRNKGVFVNQQHLGPVMSGKVSDILCDEQGRTWISMFDGGLELVTTGNDGSMTVQSFFKGSHNISQPRSMIQDDKGRIWLCSNKGVYVFSPDQLIKDPSAYQHINVNGNLVNSDEVHCLYKDGQQRIWAGTTGYGLVELDTQGKLIQRFTTSDGMPNNRIESIIEDKDGCLWVGTSFGLAKLDKSRQHVNSFFLSNQEQGLMYTEGCALQLEDGRLAMGTQHGMQVFDPRTIKPTPNIFPLAITNLFINGTSIQDLDDVDFSHLLPLRLSHDQNSLTIHFSAFEYAGSNLSKYTYILEGFDNEWSELSTFNFATYKNLPPGSYTLRVRSYNIYGLQNAHEATLDITIRQPWWNTWWAWIFYFFFIGAISWAIWRQWRNTEELHTKIKVENQLTEFKLRFFTNISHEFRTPLTIIRGAMDRISAEGEIPGKLKQPISSMQKSTDRLLRLINELLEFRKIQNQKLRLQLEETEIIGFLRNIFQTFSETAQNRHINYQFSTFTREYKLYIDQNYVDKMAYNLLSNAFKYTPHHREITMRVSLNDDHLSFAVEDTGIGVPRDKQNSLFTRFDQSAFSRESIGIGLHMVSELVRVHHGTIIFRENPAGGSIFSITLPTDKSIYSESDFLMSTGNSLLGSEESSASSQASSVTYKEMATPPLNDRTVVVVDDDDDMREHVAQELRRFFHVETACDGGEALEKIATHRPDLVVSDVQMPGMNGFDLVRKLRQDSDNSDLPVILLTGIIDEEKQVKGTEYGADDYIVKPFNSRVLVARCCALIEQRERLRQKYAKEVVGSAPLADIIVEDADKKFLERFENWVSAHMSQPDMQAMDFANSMKMGRTTFFKKVKQVTGMPPHEYIRKMRMTQAAEMLKDPTLSISEVAYKAGFDDPNYFSRNFKEYFGVTASQFRKGKVSASPEVETPNE